MTFKEYRKDNGLKMILEVRLNMLAAVMAPDGEIYTGTIHALAYEAAIKAGAYAKFGITDPMAMQDKDFRKIADNTIEGFWSQTCNQFYDREHAYRLASAASMIDTPTHKGQLDSTDLDIARVYRAQNRKLNEALL